MLWRIVNGVNGFPHVYPMRVRLRARLRAYINIFYPLTPLTALTVIKINQLQISKPVDLPVDSLGNPLTLPEVAMSKEEEGLIKTARGKWSRAGVPHRGWWCIEIEDLGGVFGICEMCECMPIRWVQHMAHHDYPDVLGCGCVCAGEMQQNRKAAEGRDHLMRSRSAKRARWLRRQWKRSLSGNPWIEADGYRVVIYPRAHGFGAVVSGIDHDYERHARRVYATAAEAQLAAFDLITKLIYRREATCQQH